MKFGQTDNPEDVDLTLPDDQVMTDEVLAASKATEPKVYLGCAKWVRDDWVGKIYPPKTKQANFLNEYVKHYNSVELNATHYRIFDRKTVEKWRDVAPDGFLYSPKFYQGISHHKRLRGAEDLTKAFYESVSALEEHLGPLFLQLHDNFKPDLRDNILRYVSDLPKTAPVFLEVRNPGWFVDSSENEAFYKELQRMGIGLVISDAAGRRDVCHMRLTIPSAFVRFVGNSLHPTDYQRVDDWVARIKKWLGQGIEAVYFFMHMHDELYSPELSQYMAKKLNEECGLNLIVPKLHNEESNLFG